MRKRTESLTFPKDPLAAMRELQELNSPARPDSPFKETVKSPSGTADKAALPATQDIEEREHPLQSAILQLLAAPYPSPLSRGPFTVSSVKIHSDLWNRLGLACTLTGRPKQEIIAEAIRTYLEILCATYANQPGPQENSENGDDNGDDMAP